MPKFRKKPVVIEAIRFDGTVRGIEEAQAFLGSLAKTDIVAGIGYVVCIDTLEGEMRARPGDWIIKGTGGEFYPCKPDIFAAIYDPVDEVAEVKRADAGRRMREAFYEKLERGAPPGGSVQ